MASAKSIVGIDCEGPARAGIVLGLSMRLDEMCALRAAAVDFSSPDGVHDMRVASRRLRGALADFMPYLGEDGLSDCLEEIKGIASALGRVRDHDVAIITLTETASKAPTKIAGGIGRFADMRRAMLAEARTQLVLVLAAEGLRLLRRKFTDAVDGNEPRAQTKYKQTSTAVPRYRDVAREIILSRLDELEESSKSLYRPLRVKPLHKLRIKAKHLRYALQLFGACWGESLQPFSKKVSGLQTSLGKLHDCDVWLEDFGDVTIAGADLGFDYRATSIWLLTHFHRLRSRHYGDALSQWHEWQTEEFSVSLRECIQPDIRP